MALPAGAVYRGIRRFVFAQPPVRHVRRTPIDARHFAAFVEQRAAVASGGNHGVVQNERNGRLPAGGGDLAVLANGAFGQCGRHVVRGLGNQKNLPRLAPHASGVHQSPGREAVLGEREGQLLQAVHHQERHVRPFVQMHDAGHQLGLGLEWHNDDAIFVRHAVRHGDYMPSIGDGEARTHAAQLAVAVCCYDLDEARPERVGVGSGVGKRRRERDGGER